VKAEVKVTVVKERLCIAETFKTRRINIGGNGIGLLYNTDKIFSPPKFVDRKETLKTDEDTWETLPEEKSKVKSGDPAIELISQE
jgi:hypothetical protein